MDYLLDRKYVKGIGYCYVCSICHKEVRTTIYYKGQLLQVNPYHVNNICTRCNKRRRTAMHHEKYHDDDPLKDTVEMCSSCHAKITHKANDLRTYMSKVMKVLEQ